MVAGRWLSTHAEEDGERSSGASWGYGGWALFSCTAIAAAVGPAGSAGSMSNNGAWGDHGAACHQGCLRYSVAKQAASATPLLQQCHSCWQPRLRCPSGQESSPAQLSCPAQWLPAPHLHMLTHAATCPLAAAGLFLAPQMVGEALKGGRLVAEVLSRAGFKCLPAPGMPPTHSFITAVEMGSPERMVAFCCAVQRCCPVGSYVQPEPGEHTAEEAVLFGRAALLPCGVTAKCSKTPVSRLVTVACWATLYHPARPGRGLLG